MVTFNCNIQASAAISSNTVLMKTGTIPSGWRPADDINIAVYGGVVFQFFANGTVQTQNISDSITAYYHVISGAYFTS